MTFGINTNISSLAAQRALRTSTRNQDNNFRKLSSGERITRAGDDAAGLAISEKLKAHIRGVRQADRNAGDAVSMIQTSEGALNEVSNMIIRLRELAIQSASDTIGQVERGFADKEFQSLKEEVDRIARSTQFNGTQLLNGTGGIFEFQIGIHNDPVLDRLRYDSTRSDATLETLGLISESIATKIGAQTTLSALDNALVTINGTRAELGALQNRLISTKTNLAVLDENLSAANSRIRDVDIASESADLAKNNILVTAGTSVLAQANQIPTVALKLLS